MKMRTQGGLAHDVLNATSGLSSTMDAVVAPRSLDRARADSFVTVQASSGGAH
jgi:hypothetical protein